LLPFITPEDLQQSLSTSAISTAHNSEFTIKFFYTKRAKQSRRMMDMISTPRH
jgi:hypothetical protein